MNKNYLLIIRPAIRYTLIAGLFLFSTTSPAQDSLGMVYLKLANVEYKAGEFSMSSSYFRNAKNRFAQVEDWIEWYTAFNGLRKIAHKTKDRAATIDSLKMYYESLPDSVYNILRRCYAGRGYNLQKIGMQVEALYEYKKAYNVISNQFPEDTLNRLKYLRSISHRYSALGDPISSLKFIEEGIRLAEKSNNQKELCRLLFYKGNSLFHDDKNEDAISAFLNYQNLCGESVTNYCCIANAYQQIDKLDLTKKHLSKAEALLKENGNEVYEQNIYLNYKAEYLARIDKHGEAIKIKRQILERIEHQDDLRQYVKDLVSLAQIEEKAGFLEEMLSDAHKALSFHFTEIDSSDVYDRPEKVDALPDIWIIEALYLKAKYFKHKFENNDSDFKSKEESSFYHQLIFDYFDQLKGNYSANSSKYRIGGHTRSYYEGIVDFYCSQYISNNTNSDFEKGFELSQMANAYVLKNAISEREALEIADLSQDSIDLYTDLLQLANNEKRSEDILKFEKLKEELGDRIAYFKNDENSAVIGIDEIQNILKDGELLLKYFYIQNDLILFRVTNHSAFVDKIIVSSKLDSLIDRHQDLISKSGTWNEEEYKVISFEIYNSILSKCILDTKEEDINHLIIIPDGPIKKIAFSSIIQKEVKDFIKASDYLINDYEISYLYYASQIRNIRSKSKSSKKGFISFGIEYEDSFLKEILDNYRNQTAYNDGARALSLAKLKFANEEAKNIAKILDGDHLTNNEVTISAVQERINDYDILHLSTHAFVDLDNYLNSFLVLNKDKSEEYKWSYQDILKMGLNNDFVVLSACQTANGQDYSGEGLMSLSRAFVQSGCSSTMSSYWNASDKSTMDVMELFYKELVEGRTKSAALRNAQLEYLLNDDVSVPSTRSPYYWSSWSIYGDNSKIGKENLSNKILTSKYIKVFGLFILAGILLLFYRKKLIS